MSDYPTVIIISPLRHFAPTDFVIRRYAPKSIMQAICHNLRLAGEQLDKLAAAIYPGAPSPDRNLFCASISAAYKNCALAQGVVYDTSLIVHAQDNAEDANLVGAKYKHHEVQLPEYTVSLNTLEIDADIFTIHHALKNQTLRAVTNFFDKSRHDLLHASMGEFEFTHPESPAAKLRLCVDNFDYLSKAPYLDVCMEYNLRNAIRAVWRDVDSQNEISADMDDIFFNLGKDLKVLEQQGNPIAYRYARHVIGLTIQTLGYLTDTACPIYKNDFSAVPNWEKLDLKMQQIANDFQHAWPEFSALLDTKANQNLFKSIIAATDFMPGDEDGPAITPKPEGAKDFILRRLKRLNQSIEYIISKNCGEIAKGIHFTAS